MRWRVIIGAVMVGGAIVPASADAWRGPEAQDRQANDSHDLQRQRGDVMVVSNETAPPSSAPRASGERCRGDHLRPGMRVPHDVLRGYGSATGVSRHHLPAGSARQRWLRIGGDLVLVDRATGRIARVAHNVIHCPAGP